MNTYRAQMHMIKNITRTTYVKECQNSYNKVRFELT